MCKRMPIRGSILIVFDVSCFLCWPCTIFERASKDTNSLSLGFKLQRYSNLLRVYNHTAIIRAAINPDPYAKIRQNSTLSWNVNPLSPLQSSKQQLKSAKGPPIFICITHHNWAEGNIAFPSCCPSIYLLPIYLNQLPSNQLHESASSQHSV